MKGPLFFTLPLFFSLTISSCKSPTSFENNIDKDTYINDFELIHDNPGNNTKIIINSPKAILDSATQNILILNNQIQILDKPDKEIHIKSGNATFNKTTKSILATDNIVITDNKNQDNSLETSKLNWNLNNSVINLDNELTIHLPNTNIYSRKGTYDINLDQINLKDVLFKRNSNTMKGFPSYEISITSDNTKWLKENDSLEFTSDKGQVETTIDLFN